jgi:hypothetical protein
VLLEIDARFNPESAGASGINGLDEQIIDLKSDSLQRQAHVERTAEKILTARLAVERDPLVRQDLEILIHADRESIRGFELREKYDISYPPAAQIV